MSLNIICAVLFFALQAGIGFFLAPFILKNLGESAYGFLVLCNAIVSWGFVFSSLVNAVAGRFVAFEFNKNNIKTASEIYSSTMLANIAFSVITIILSLIIILNIHTIFKIDEALLNDAKITFLLYSLNFILGLFNAVFAVHAFVKNKMYLISLRQTFGAFIMAVLIFCFYKIFKAQIFYTAAAVIVSSIFVLICSVFMIKILKTTIEFRLNLFKISHIKTLVKSGILGSIQTLAQISLASTDLLLVGVFLGADKMGILALAKTIIVYINSFISSISNNFMPKLVGFYAKGEISTLVSYLIFYTRLLCFIALAPIAVFIALCPEFYSLWLGFRDDNLFIARLAMISALPAILLSCMQPLILLNLITNKQKNVALAMIFLAFFTFIFQALALKFAYGLVEILLISSIFYCIKILCFDISNAAILLGLEKFYFMKEFVRNFAIFMIILIFLWLLKSFLYVNTWFYFIFSGGILAIFAYILSFFILFNKEERKICLQKIKIL